MRRHVCGDTHLRNARITQTLTPLYTHVTHTHAHTHTHITQTLTPRYTHDTHTHTHTNTLSRSMCGAISSIPTSRMSRKVGLTRSSRCPFPSSHVFLYAPLYVSLYVSLCVLMVLNCLTKWGLQRAQRVDGLNPEPNLLSSVNPKQDMEVDKFGVIKK
jgi:mRNA-degrading endonuclease toxin of MazEF toxin-antitoxin module